MNVDTSSSMKQLMATRPDRFSRASVVRSDVLARKIGAPPSGLTIGSSAATASSTVSVNCRRSISMARDTSVLSQKFTR
jgi:hypothetical protein